MNEQTLLGLPNLFRTGVRHLRSPDRNRRLRLGLRYWVHLEQDILPSVYLTDLWPTLNGVAPTCGVGIRHIFELPYGERLVLAAIAHHVAPGVVFEFGTFSGSTTRLLSDSAPSAIVHTLDLPPEELPEPWLVDAIGREFRDLPHYRDRIRMHRQNSRAFDGTPFHRGIDLIFVDGSHEYEDVLHDSRMALDMRREGGVIVWDDYQAIIPGVVMALNELSREHRLFRIMHTRLVVYAPDIRFGNGAVGGG